MKDSGEYPGFDKQTRFWNEWNSTHREGRALDSASERRAAFVFEHVEAASNGGEIIDIGCGTGWVCDRLTRFGKVTGTDLADDVLERSAKRYPNVTFIAGDFGSLELPTEHFEIVVCMETIAHVPDQDAFLKKVAAILKANGTLILTTQNPYVWNRTSTLAAPGDGQIRNWPTKRQLADRVSKYFFIRKLTTLAPGGDRGLLSIVNNPKLNALVRRLVPARTITHLKENAGFGQSIAVVGHKKAAEN